MQFRPGNAQHAGAREEQQDAFAFSDADDHAFVAHGGVLAVVADGMGGLDGGRAASAAAVRAFLQTYCAKGPEDAIPTALERSLQAASAAVQAAAPEPDRAGGTTLVAAVLHETGLHWVSVGDSRVYLIRAGEVAQVTLDHIYARELDARAAAGALSASEAAAHPERESLVSYLGQGPVAEVDRSVRPLPLRLDDLVLVCSDGVYRALTDAEMAAVSAAARDPQGVCEALVAAVLAKQLPQQDNCTVLAVSGRVVSGRYADAAGAHV
jgi:protein phosphatase